MQNFFPCDDCSGHFAAMAAEDDAVLVQSPDDALLWSWRAHNRVSGHLNLAPAATYWERCPALCALGRTQKANGLIPHRYSTEAEIPCPLHAAAFPALSVYACRR